MKLDKERFQQIKSIFDEALSFNQPERESFLNLKCGNDSELKNEVLSLLKSIEKSEDFLESQLESVYESGKKLEDVLIGRQIGNYLVDGKAGVGGMGIVYTGKRNDKEFEQKVAIKILKYGFNSDYHLKRFQIERQTLAKLQHPNIARLLDGGKTTDGLPYLIMEFIDGIPITEYCDQKRLSIEQRLRLFTDVCTAVQYAHQNLVIHRDIKPGNILVTETGVPKLLDFGIAKLLDEDFAGIADGLTKTGIWHLTPEFASPEQIKGENVTTASDIYSLGVLLYLVLSGHKPYHVSSVSPIAISSVITGENILKPSDIIKKTREIKSVEGEVETLTPADIGKRRNQKPEKLFNHLKGDLDNIVMKAMHKDPSRRYVSVEQFSEDIRRHLVGLPVIARKDTASYLLSKFVQRHKTGFIISILFVLFLIASIISIAWQADIASSERNKAKIEARKLERVNMFLQGMLSSVNPREIGRDVKVYDVLEKASKDIETELRDQPETEIEIRRSIGNTYTSLGEYDRAEIHLFKALQLSERVYGKESQEVATSLHDIALYYHWLGNFHISDSLYHKADGIYRRVLNEPTQSMANNLNDYALVLSDLGSYEEAKKFFEEALDMSEKINGSKSTDVASIMNNLAINLHYLKDLKNAEKYYLKSQEIYIELLGEDRPEVASTYNNLAFVAMDKNNLAQAEEYFTKSYNLKLKLMGEDHPDVGLALNNLGAVQLKMKNFNSAEDYFVKAISQFKKTLPQNHVWAGISYYLIGKTLLEKQRYKSAELNFRKALSIRKKAFPKGHNLIYITEGELGLSLLKQNKLNEAEKYLLSGYNGCKASLGEKDSSTVRFLQQLPVVYGKLSDNEKVSEYEEILNNLSDD